MRTGEGEHVLYLGVKGTSCELINAKRGKQHVSSRYSHRGRFAIVHYTSEAKPIKTREEEHALLSAKKGHHARMNFGGKGLETLL